MVLEKNLGNIERVIRVVIGIIVLGLVYANTITGWWSFASLIFGVFQISTAFLGYCMLYDIIGWNPVKV